MRGLLCDARGTVAVLMAVGLLALGTATGVGVDFARGLNFKSALQNAVDAAAIAGASLYVTDADSSAASTAATGYMNKALPSLPGNTGVTFSVATSSTLTGNTVVVSANGAITATFTGLIMPSIPVSVSGTAVSPTPPNINFYLLLDDSPSMAIAATASGITWMVNNTQGQCDSAPYGGSNCGCAFACHESNPAGESHYIPTGTGSPTCTASNNYQYCNVSGTGNPGGEDNYALATTNGVTLRIDMLRTATQSLMTTAQATEVTNNSVYGMAIYTFDVALNTIQTLTSNLAIAQTSAGNISLLEVYQNNMVTSSNTNSDEDTNYDNAMSSINAIMPDPGNGQNGPGDTPQEVLFIVTDGVEDEYQSPTLNPTSGTAGRQQYLMNSNTDWCTAVKNRGIRIAVLYTYYLPLPTNGWYNNFDGTGAGISSFQANIGTQLQTCASPGLYFEVTSDSDITAAMAALFQTAIQTAYLSK